MNDWLRSNFWNLLITGAALVSAWTMTDSRIRAIEISQEDVKSSYERLIIAEQSVKQSQKDIDEIKKRSISIEEKIDKVIEQHINLRETLKK